MFFEIAQFDDRPPKTYTISTLITNLRIQRQKGYLLTPRTPPSEQFVTVSGGGGLGNKHL